MDAAEAYASASFLPPLPAFPQVPAAPGTPPSPETGPGTAAEIAVQGLECVAARAADEAHRLLAAALSARYEQLSGELAPGQDAVRIPAALPAPARGCDAEITARLAAGSGRDPDTLARAVRAWQHGGASELQALEQQCPEPGGTRTRAYRTRHGMGRRRAPMPAHGREPLDRERRAGTGAPGP
ncbi:hypothetical protein GCM10018793_08560 [Streptomyces sulfonofaciens]|uniref:Uncharacterized protein n=1 Tax=Streptomyces sulfonofaciens TaxID=68272 RepID=A0A919FUB7_9ACTN|nr:hypothetical protein GCM10018793_08560 [Streptomyces sulfonofaciens]